MKCIETWGRKRKGREAKGHSIRKGTKSNQKNEKKNLSQSSQTYTETQSNISYDKELQDC